MQFTGSRKWWESKVTMIKVNLLKSEGIFDNNQQKESRKNDSWDDFIESLHMFPDDFMIERNQPTEFDKREPLFE